MRKRKFIIGVGAVAVLAGAISLGTIYLQGDNVKAMEQTKSKTTNIIEPIAKEEIHSLMLNSIDNFEKADGSFIYRSESAGYEYKVNYSVNTKKNNYKSLVKMESANDSREVSFDGNTSLTVVDNKSKVFKKFTVEKPQDESAKYANEKSQNRYKKNKKGEKVYERRLDPTYMDMASLSLFPEDFALGFLEDDNNWNITSEDERLNGLDVIAIEGMLNPYYQMKHHTKNFKLWIEKNTGIVLQMEEYDEIGNATEYLKTNSIKINDLKNNVPDIKIPDNYMGRKF